MELRLDQRLQWPVRSILYLWHFLTSPFRATVPEAHGWCVDLSVLVISVKESWNHLRGHDLNLFPVRYCFNTCLRWEPRRDKNIWCRPGEQDFYSQTNIYSFVFCVVWIGSCFCAAAALLSHRSHAHTDKQCCLWGTAGACKVCGSGQDLMCRSYRLTPIHHWSSWYVT